MMVRIHAGALSLHCSLVVRFELAITKYLYKKQHNHSADSKNFL